MITSSILAEVEARFGKLVQLSAKGRITRFNEHGAAALFAQTNEVVFAVEEQNYYIYDPDTGRYDPQSREDMLSALDLFIHEWALESSTEALEADIRNAEEAERAINACRDRLRTWHLADIEKSTYPYETGSFYMDLINCLEKMGDFIINISQSVLEAKVV